MGLKTSTSAQHSSQSCDMLRWRFKTYVSPSGRKEVQAELDRMDDYGLEQFKRQVTYLAGTAQRSDWSEPQAKRLKGNNNVDLYEIRFKHANKATRALGFFGPEPGMFTITLIATHKQDVYNPQDALNTAQRRRADICGAIASAVPLCFDGEEFPPIPDEEERSPGVC